MRNQERLRVNPAVGDYRVPVKNNDMRQKWLRGGLAETVAALEAVLLCSFLTVLSVPLVFSIPGSLALFLVCWVIAAPREGQKK